MMLMKRVLSHDPKHVVLMFRTPDIQIYRENPKKGAHGTFVHGGI